MKNKSLIAVAVSLALAITVSAQSNTPPVPIKGTIDINFQTRASSSPVKGVRDTYVVNINVAQNVLFRGNITDRPQIIEGYINKTVEQTRELNYNIACDLVNPKNQSQTKNVGQMLGRVGITPEGVYRYDTGTLEVSILPSGNAVGFTSKFGGSAAGKPLARPANWMDTLKRETVNITRSVNGKSMTVQLKKYDKMEFRSHVVAGGPAQIYQPVTVNGEMLYDYDKKCWFFNNMTVQYAEIVGNTSTMRLDRVAGTIRWIESKTGGEYQFDVRVNEPVASVASAFAAPSDESAFFENDTTVSALMGTMKYKDTLRGDKVMASHVDIDLLGNNLNKIQTMVLGKVIIFSAVVPMNSD